MFIVTEEEKVSEEMEFQPFLELESMFDYVFDGRSDDESSSDDDSNDSGFEDAEDIITLNIELEIELEVSCKVAASSNEDSSGEDSSDEDTSDEDTSGEDTEDSDEDSSDEGSEAPADDSEEFAENRCVRCGIDMGEQNGRQLCRKTYCQNEETDEDILMDSTDL